MEGAMKLYLLLDLIILAASVKVILLNTTRDGWKDWKKNTEKYHGWRIQNLPPNGDEVYGVCNINQLHSNSWLMSPFIGRQNGITLHIKLYFTMRECKSYLDTKLFENCKEVFHILKYEADTDSEEVQYDEKYFINVSTISSNLKWEGKDRTENILNVHESTTSVTRLGVIFAFKNTGSCVMIKEVVVYYSQCPALISNFVSFPQTATSSEILEKNIEGRCVEGALKISSSEELLNDCQSDGQWRKSVFPEVCECSRGHQGNKNKTTCSKCIANFFKDGTGNKDCVRCPKSSFSLMGSSKCICNAGYYEIPSLHQILICRKPPENPKNLDVDASDQARIILSWDLVKSEEPSDPNINKSLHYVVACVNCPNRLIMVPSTRLSGNKVVVHGALPSREYNFKVTTENYVTPYVTHAFDLDQSISRVAVLTSPLENIEKIEIDRADIVNNLIRVNWLKPRSSSNGVEYECVITGYREKDIDSETYPEVEIYSFSLETKCVLSKLDQGLRYKVKVRWRNSRGWGQYSETKNIEREKDSATLVNVEVKIDSMIFPNTSTESSLHGPTEKSKKDAILVIVGAILFIIILIIIAILASCFIRRQMLYSSYRMKVKKKKYDSSNRNQMIYSSVQSSIKYHDPSAYEDISLALQDFTKEIDPSWIFKDALISEGKLADIFFGTMKIIRGEKKVVAIKVLKAIASQKERNNFLIEASTMGQFSHENIVRLEGVVSLSDPQMIVTEYLVNGSLLNFLITNKDKMSISQQLKMLSNVAAGMKYLSSKGFTHGDLAARNILLDEDLTCKIADFGLSREVASDDLEMIYQNKNEIKIPIKWSSPEAILCHRFSEAGDVWSFGVLSWEILSNGDKPYWQWSNQEVIDAIQSGYRLPPPVNCPPIIHNLMLHCWNSKADQRPTFTQLYFEIDKLITRLNSDLQITEFDSRKDLNNCEKTHLLRQCIESHYDANTHIIAPQPPPRNIVFDSRNVRVPSETLGFPVTLTRQSSGFATHISNRDLKIKEPIMSLPMMNQNVFPLQPFFQTDVLFQSSTNKYPHDYRPYGFDSPNKPYLNTIKSLSKDTKLEIEEFLLRIQIPQYTHLLRKNGIDTIEKLQQMSIEHLKSIGIVSLEDRIKIIRGLHPSVHC